MYSYFTYISRLLPGEVKTFFGIIFRVDKAFSEELMDELIQTLEDPDYKTIMPKLRKGNNLENH